MTTRRSARLAVTQVLAQAATLAEAAPRILQAVGEGLGWDLGGFWTVDRPANVLRCQEVWHTAAVRAPAYGRDRIYLVTSRVGSYSGTGLSR